MGISSCVQATQGEKCERELRELVRKNKRPVALFVDARMVFQVNTGADDCASSIASRG